MTDLITRLENASRPNTLSKTTGLQCNNSGFQLQGHKTQILSEEENIGKPNIDGWDKNKDTRGTESLRYL